MRKSDMEREAQAVYWRYSDDARATEFQDLVRLWDAYTDVCRQENRRPTPNGFVRHQVAREQALRDTYAYWTHAEFCDEEDDPYCRGECTK